MSFCVWFVELLESQAFGLGRPCKEYPRWISVSEIQLMGMTYAKEGQDCLNRSDYDHVLNDEINPYPTDNIPQDGFEQFHAHDQRESVLEHPCLALKKLLSSGTFYYSVNFDVTKRLQDR